VIRNTQADSCKKDDVEIQQRDIQNLLYSRRLKTEDDDCVKVLPKDTK